MRAINYGFQYPDFTKEDFGEISFEKGIDVFKSFSWDEQIQKFKEREESGGESAPPNISFTDGKYNFMIWADPNQRFGIIASVPIKRLIFNGQKALEFNTVNEEGVCSLLKSYFEGDFETIKNYKV